MGEGIRLGSAAEGQSRVGEVRRWEDAEASRRAGGRWWKGRLGAQGDLVLQEHVRNGPSQGTRPESTSW